MHGLLICFQRTLTISLPGSPWENGYIESFNGKFRDELLNCEIFETLFETKVLIERWRMEYNTFRPHSSLGYLPPVPETVDLNSNFKGGTKNGGQVNWHTVTNLLFESFFGLL
jgi:hypothetical protein